SNQKAYLYLNSDCNLVLYTKKKSLWSTQTTNKGTECILRLQEDGNLVLYSYNKEVIWASGT
ncbi:hypothetical protein SELMODRAFT_19248, partial [Selaginella moellendorffii]